MFHPGLGLSETGLQEALAIRKSLGGDRQFTEVVSFDHIRALGTLAVVIFSDQHEYAADKLESDPRFSYDAGLDYLDPGDGEFGTRLFEAYLSNRNFLFIVNHSDGYFSSQDPISSFTYMSSITARSILDKINLRKSNNDDILLCAREFILPALRAKLIRLNDGDSEMQDYVNWYSRSQEAVDSARLTITEITAGNDHFVFSDAYKTSTHSVEELTVLAGEDHATQAHS
jgi:hypothetical protein